MTRRFLWLVVAMLCCPFVVAPSGFAECAWVLWQQLPTGAEDWSLERGQRSPTKQAEM